MYRRTVIENGVRVLTQSVPGLRCCTLGVLVDAGPRDEPAAKAGVAHLAEHLIFEGTANRDALQIARVMDAAGGQFGGFITRDYTCYAATVLDDYAPYALDLFGDLLLNSTYPAGCVAAQAATVGRELAALADRPERLVNDLLKQSVWPGHPLGRPVAGDPDTVSGLTREDVIGFVRRNYLPGRMIVAAAGSVDHDDFTAQVRDGFWRLLGTGRPHAAAAPVYHPGVTVVARPFRQAYFALAVPAPEYASADRYRWHLLTAVLGGGNSSRLFRQVREAHGLAFHVAAEYHAYADAGLLVVEGGTAAEDLPAVVELVWAELWGLADGSAPVSDDELWRAKMQLRGQYLLGGQDTGTLFGRLTTQERYFGRAIPDVEFLTALEGMDAAALARLATTRLAAALASPALAAAGPESPGGTADRLRGLLAPDRPPARRRDAGRRRKPRSSRAGV